MGDIALDMVRRAKGGPEPFVLHSQGPEVIKAAVQAVLASGEAPTAMADRLKAVVLVAYVLEEKERSPSAAKALLKALFADPEVVRIMQARGDEAERRQKAYQKFLADEDRARAPQLGAAAPANSVKATSFMTPGQQDLARARRVGTKLPTPTPKAPEAKPAPEKVNRLARRLPPGSTKA